MYINLVLGAVALAVVWLFLKKMLVREDELTVSPSELLEKELAKRRERDEQAAAVFERLRDIAVQRMRPVADALEEMRAALPEGDRERLSWDDGGDTIVIRMLAAGSGPNSPANSDSQGGRPALTVTWRAREVVIGGQGTAAGGGEFLLRRDGRSEEAVPTLDACARAITSFIVAFMS